MNWGSKSDNRWGFRFDAELSQVDDDQADDLMADLENLAGVCESLRIEHIVCFYKDGSGYGRGDLDCGEYWVGPSNFVKASCKVRRKRTETVELTLSDEIYLEGGEVEELRPRYI